MNDTLTSGNTKKALDRGHNFAAIGLFVTFLAFSLSVATPWVYEAFAPPPPPVEDVIKEEAVSFSKKLFSSFFGGEVEAEVEVKVKEAEETEKEKPTEHWTDYWSLIVIAIAIGGLLNATIGVLQKENKYITRTAIFFGVSAIIVQYLLIALGILLVLIVLVFLLSAIGVDF